MDSSASTRNNFLNPLILFIYSFVCLSGCVNLAFWTMYVMPLTLEGVGELGYDGGEGTSCPIFAALDLCWIVSSKF